MGMTETERWHGVTCRADELQPGDRLRETSDGWCDVPDVLREVAVTDSGVAVWFESDAEGKDPLRLRANLRCSILRPVAHEQRHPDFVVGCQECLDEAVEGFEAGLWQHLPGAVLQTAVLRHAGQWAATTLVCVIRAAEDAPAVLQVASALDGQGERWQVGAAEAIDQERRFLEGLLHEANLSAHEKDRLGDQLLTLRAWQVPEWA